MKFEEHSMDAGFYNTEMNSMCLDSRGRRHAIFSSLGCEEYSFWVIAIDFVVLRAFIV